MAPYEPFNSQQQQQYPQMNGQNNNNIICQPTHNQNNNNSQSTTTATTTTSASAGGTTKVALCASCDRCRTRKTKCDGERPCSNCATRYKKVMKVDRYVFYYFLQIICIE